MAWSGKFRKIDDNRWEISKEHMPCMRTDAVIFSNESMLDSIMDDNSPQQVANVACLPGIVGRSLAMPDIHFGYGFPIGGVAAVDADSGSISPGGIGFDINCGVRTIRTNLTLDDIKGKKSDLIDALYKNVPSGLGSKGLTRVDMNVINDILSEGSRWAVENGFGWEKDLDVTEECGTMATADPTTVSDKAKKRGIPQLGSLGSGNHFLELDVVDEIFDEDVARSFGLEKGQITVTVHCGSRGCGHHRNGLSHEYGAIHKRQQSLPSRQTTRMCPVGYRYRGEILQSDVMRSELRMGQSSDDNTLDQRILRDDHGLFRREHGHRSVV